MTACHTFLIIFFFFSKVSTFLQYFKAMRKGKGVYEKERERENERESKRIRDYTQGELDQS